MALEGKELTIEIDTTSTPLTPNFVPLGSCDAYAVDRTRQQNERAVFGSDETLKATSAASTTLRIAGARDLDDAGQQALFSKIDAGDDVNLRVLYDGANGYTRVFKLVDDGEAADAGGWQDFSFTASPVGDKTPVAGS